MNLERIHRAVSDDGTEIAGRVHGQGPPVVFGHGAVADGDSEWGALVPLLSDRFTCYLPSTRGRGLSGAHPDVSREARVADIAAFVESIGEPVTLVGVSGGGMVALGVAARSDAVSALVAREPVVLETIDEETRARFREIVAFVAEALPEGRAVEAAGAFLEFVANDEEQAALSEDEAGLDELATYLPIDLEQFRGDLAFEGPSPTDSAVLERITAPTLLLHGSDTALTWFTDSARYAAEHVRGATMREIPGVGHLGHLVHPQRDSAELIPFLESVTQAA